LIAGNKIVFFDSKQIEENFKRERSRTGVV